MVAARGLYGHRVAVVAGAVNAALDDQPVTFVESLCVFVRLCDEKDVLPGGRKARVQLSHQGAADTASLLSRVDIDAVEFRLDAFGVVVQVADHLAVSFGDEKLRVVSVGAVRDAVGQRRGRVGLLDHRCGELCTNDVAVYRRERDPADCSNRGRVACERRADYAGAAPGSLMTPARRVQTRCPRTGERRLKPASYSPIRTTGTRRAGGDRRGSRATKPSNQRTYAPSA